MLKIVNHLYKNSDKNLNEALDYFSPSKKSQVTIMEAFHKIQLSPISIQSPDIPYMQSVESLLEFEIPCKKTSFLLERILIISKYFISFLLDK